MAEYGITENGFNRKTREDIVNDMEQAAKNKWGNDVNLSSKSPLGILIALVSWPLALIWMALEGVYNSSWINTATDQQLNNVVEYMGLTRSPAKKATGTVTFSGDENTEIPPEFKVETGGSDSVVFETTNDENEVIDSSGTIDIEVQAVEAGEDGNVPANTIDKITNPISGLDSVDNESETAGGQDRETDSELRERYKESTDRPGGSTANSIRANILEKTDATACIVLENTTNEDDANGNGLNAKSFEAITYGGTEQDIADAIFEKKPAGMEAFGEISVNVTDDAGLTKTVDFSRATGVDIYVDIEIETDNKFPSDGDTQIKDKIIEYIGGNNSEDEYKNGLSIGNDVIYTQLYNKIYSVDGVTDVPTLNIDTSDDPTGTSNITIDFREVALTDTGKVDITHV